MPEQRFEDDPVRFSLSISPARVVNPPGSVLVDDIRNTGNVLGHPQGALPSREVVASVDVETGRLTSPCGPHQHHAVITTLNKQFSSIYLYRKIYREGNIYLYIYNCNVFSSLFFIKFAVVCI